MCHGSASVISYILKLRDILLSFQSGFNIVSAVIAEFRYLKRVTVSSFQVVDAKRGNKNHVPLIASQSASKSVIPRSYRDIKAHNQRDPYQELVTCGYSILENV